MYVKFKCRISLMSIHRSCEFTELQSATFRLLCLLTYVRKTFYCVLNSTLHSRSLSCRSVPVLYVSDGYNKHSFKYAVDCNKA